MRDPVLDQLAREALLALSSDWAFMVTKDTAAGYARDRAKIHSDRFSELATLVRGGRGRCSGGGRCVRRTARSAIWTREE